MSDSWRSSETGEALSDRLEEAKIAAGEKAAAAAQALEARAERPEANINEPGQLPPLPIPGPRGDEHLCARCASHPGEEMDREGRMLCLHCLAEVEAAA